MAEYFGAPPAEYGACPFWFWNGALDPAKAAVANLPGGAADAVGLNPLPEFHVVRLRGVDGGCQ